MFSTSGVETLLSGEQFICFETCMNLKDLIRSVTSFSSVGGNCLKCKSVYYAVLSSIMDPGVCNSSPQQPNLQSSLGAAHTLSTSSYLWQVVWHLQSPPAGAPHWQPAAQKREGSVGIEDKGRWGYVGGPHTSLRLPFKLPFADLLLVHHVFSCFCVKKKKKKISYMSTPENSWLFFSYCRNV